MPLPSLRLLTVLIIFACAPFTYGQVVINEFVSDNDGDTGDLDGHDWIELFNTADSAVSLLNYSLSDSRLNLRKAVLPASTLGPRSFILLFASGKDTVSGSNIFLDFKIEKGGEPLFLTSPAQTVLDSVPAIALEENLSYGRATDGEGEFIIFRKSTPGYSNRKGVRFEYGMRVSFTPLPGFYRDSVVLNLTTGRPDEQIYYTMDGTIPDTTSTRFTHDIHIKDRSSEANQHSTIVTWPEWTPWPTGTPQHPIDKATIVRVRAFRDGVPVSDVSSGSYFVFPAQRNQYTLPVLSIITDPKNLFDDSLGIYVPGASFKPAEPFSGNYSNRGMLWEREANIEYIDTENITTINQLSGIRIKGLSSQIIPNKSLRISARHQYGNNEFRFSFFQNQLTEYRRLVLKPSGQDFHLSFLRDVLATAIAKQMNLDFQDYSQVVLYINGEYWGMNYLREYLDEHYISAHFGVDKDEVIMEEFTEAYQAFNKYILDHDLSNPDIYEQVNAQLDIDNYILYTLHEMYTLRWDYMNRIPWKIEGGKWRFITTDYDAAFGGPCSVNDPVSIDYVSYLLASDRPCFNTAFPCGQTTCQEKNSNILIRKLMTNVTFKEKFIEAAKFHLDNTFHPDTVKAQLHKLRAPLSNGMNAHIARWNAPESIDAWNYEISKIEQFINRRSCELRKHIAAYLGLNDRTFGDDQCTLPTSIDDDLSKAILLYPVPTDGSFVIETPWPDRFIALEVYDMMGQTIFSGEVANNAINNVTFNATGLALVKVSRGKTLIWKKIWIK